MFSNLMKRFAFVVCICVLAGFLPSTPTSAADPLVFTVNTTIDQRDLATNGVCSIGTPVGGDCTLRAAISEAIGNLPYSDIIINIPSGTYELTIPPDATNDIHTGDLDFPSITSDFTVSIIGTDKLPAVIDGNELDRVFRIGAGVRLSMENAVIRGGRLALSTENDYGAGIDNHSYLYLEKVVLEDNSFTCAEDPCPFYLIGSALSHSGTGTMTLVDTIVRNNSGHIAPAIYNDKGTVFIRNSTIAYNHALEQAVINNRGTMEFINSTVYANTAGDGQNVGINNNGVLQIYSSTFANPGPTASINNVITGSVYIQDTILHVLPGGFNSNCNTSNTGSWTSNGYNIYSDDTCPSNGLGGDLINTDPNLGPLGDWGGATPTLPLFSHSPAINHRTSTCMLALTALRNDQRYYPRNDTLCDTGSFEGSLNIYQAFLPVINK